MERTRADIGSDYEKYKICVICSTQNQMVNYIPLKMKRFNFETIYNITIAGSSHFDNATWDNNLKESTGRTFQDITLQQSDTHSVSKILENKELESLKDLDGEIFWNITGGQRTILLAIMELIKNSDKRKDDVICYLEGNNNQMYISNINHENPIPIDYSKEKFDLDIVKALKLGGFKISEVQNNENHLDANDISQFIENYKELRELLIETNKALDEKGALAKLNSSSLQNKDAIERVIKWGYSKNKSSPFGYILEEMTYHIINTSSLMNSIQELKTNIRLYNRSATEGVNNTQIDEFDVLLLTKSGKLIVFECKSGSMHPDIAKSTKYSTYAVSGVYGLPILITPLLKDEIPPSGNFNNLSKEYDGIKASVSSAVRAGLKIWGIDEIETKLKNYIDNKGS